MERTKLILPNINIKNIDNTLECFLKQVHSSDEYKKIQDDYNKAQNYERRIIASDLLIFYIIGIIIMIGLVRFRNNTKISSAIGEHTKEVCILWIIQILR